METVTIPWSLAKKLAFRFFLIYFLLYIFFNPNGVLPYSDDLFGYYIKPFHSLMVWIGKHILHLSHPITVFTNGSGDTTYDNVTLLFIASVSIVTAITWTIVDKKTASYNRLYYWLCVIIRYYVAITMVAYGFSKVFKLQFPFLSLDGLLQPYGNSSPMRLAWNFFGYSRGYNYVMAFAELLCAVLLFFRRTTTLGAIVTIVVAGNIMAINYSFDIPVKLLSTTLVLMALFLLAKDFDRVINFFFLNKPTEPAQLKAPRFREKWQNVTLSWLKCALIAYTIGITIYQSVGYLKQYGDAAPKPPLYGIYNVTKFVHNRDTLPPLATDSLRWHQLIMSYPGYGFVKRMNDSLIGYALNIDTLKKTLTMTPNDPADSIVFVYNDSSPGNLRFSGVLRKDSIVIEMKKYDINNFALVKRGFNWINEYPPNY